MLTASMPRSDVMSYGLMSYRVKLAPEIAARTEARFIEIKPESRAGGECPCGGRAHGHALRTDG